MIANPILQEFDGWHLIDGLVTDFDLRNIRFNYGSKVEKLVLELAIKRVKGGWVLWCNVVHYICGGRYKLHCIDFRLRDFESLDKSVRDKEIRKGLRVLYGRLKRFFGRYDYGDSKIKRITECNRRRAMVGV